MASMKEAQEDLLAEIKSRILAVTPEYESSLRFYARDEIDRALSEMDDDTGRIRLFEIGEGIFTAATYVGAGTRGYRYVHPIVINYPNDERWMTALNSDAELIRNDLINNATSVDGVQQRHLEPAAEMIIEKDDDDPWMQSILSLVVYYEIS